MSHWSDAVIGLVTLGALFDSFVSTATPTHFDNYLSHCHNTSTTPKNVTHPLMRGHYLITFM